MVVVGDGGSVDGCGKAFLLLVTVTKADADERAFMARLSPLELVRFLIRMKNVIWELKWPRLKLFPYLLFMSQAS
jgi:hypothetical protein